MSVGRPEIRIVGESVVLREWAVGDLPAMVEVFDDPEVAYRTPVASPFGLEAAGAYFQMIHHALGMPRLRAQIEPGNHASIAIAEKVGYRLSDDGPEKVEDARRSYALLTWIHEICPGWQAAADRAARTRGCP